MEREKLNTEMKKQTKNKLTYSNNIQKQELIDTTNQIDNELDRQKQSN